MVEETVKAFHDLYKKNAAEFPPEAKELRYLELLRLSYPIHPELFDRLSKDSIKAVARASPIMNSSRPVTDPKLAVFEVLIAHALRQPVGLIPGRPA